MSPEFKNLLSCILAAFDAGWMTEEELRVALNHAQTSWAKTFAGLVQNLRAA